MNKCHLLENSNLVLGARSELIGSANNLFCLFIFFGAKENERRVVYATPLQKGTRVIRRFTAGPLDCWSLCPERVLLKAAGILKTQTPRDKSHCYAQTV